MSALLLWPLPLLMVVLGLVAAPWYWHLPLLLEGAHWGLDGLGQPMLLAIGLVWLGALLVAGQRYRQSRLWPWLVLAQLASLVLPLALDLISFYLAFVALSLALYGLIRLYGGSRCSTVGRLYLVLMLVADGLLLEAALPLVAAADGRLLLAQLAPYSSQQGTLSLMLAVGLAIKGGALLCHGWLTALARRLPVAALLLVSALLLAAALTGWFRFGGLAASSSAPVLQLLALLALLLAAGGAFNSRQRRPAQSWLVVSQVALLFLLLTSSGPLPAHWPLLGALVVAQQPLLWLLGRLPASGRWRGLWWLLASPWWAVLALADAAGWWLAAMATACLLVSLVAAQVAAIASDRDSLDRQQPARQLLTAVVLSAAGQLALAATWLAAHTPDLGGGVVIATLALFGGALLMVRAPLTLPWVLPQGDWLARLTPLLLALWQMLLNALARLDQPAAPHHSYWLQPRRWLAQLAQLELRLGGGPLAAIALLLVLLALIALGWVGGGR